MSAVMPPPPAAGSLRSVPGSEVPPQRRDGAAAARGVLRLVEPAAEARSARSAPRRPAAAGRALADWSWHALGAGVAMASAGFATYAVIFSTGDVVPSGNFNIFSRGDRLYGAAGAQHPGPAGASPGAGAASARIETASREGVDPEPTGSLAGPAAARQGSTGPGAAAGARFRGGPDGPVLPAFTLRDVFDGKALVESRASLSVVQPGSILDGAGEVLSIEKRGEHWVVLTRNGVIAGRQR